MTKMHFKAIAKTILEADVDAATREKLASEFARTCASFNGRFDKGRFIAAATKA